MKIVTIVGARPQFVKTCVLSRFIRKEHQEILVHTGQHYDDNMSDIFFRDLGIPIPEYSLGIGSGTHGSQTGSMLIKIEEILLFEKPDWVLVYGDTNSTLAGALAAAKLHFRVAHVEAGLRSYNREMPEEINRVLTDHISELLFCPSQQSALNLKKEGIDKGVHIVGDVMYEALQYSIIKSKKYSKILDKLNLSPKGYLLTTIHRAENTDNPARLIDILSAFKEINERIVFPVHPRTRKILATLDSEILNLPNLQIIEPANYFDMAQLEESARLIMTDSGGIQKEAYWLKVPCITLREETEWVETVELGWNLLTGSDSKRILSAVNNFKPGNYHPKLYGNANICRDCVSLMESNLGN